MINTIAYVLAGILAFILLERLMSFYADFVEWFFVKAWQIRTKYKKGYYKDKPIRKVVAAIIALCFILLDIYFRMTWICVRFHVKPKFEMTTTFLKRMKRLPPCAEDDPNFYRKPLASYICASRIEPTDPGHCD